jgi:uracil DNA glycosylase
LRPLATDLLYKVCGVSFAKRFIRLLKVIFRFTSDKKKSGIVFILLGKVAQQFEDMISDENLILKASHPASAGYSKGVWDCGDVFNKTNQHLLENNKTIIQW